MQDNRAQIPENKMGVMPENRLLITMALPLMVSMLVQACYNIVDSAFVARLSEDALTAVSMAFPMQTLMIAFGVGTGVGMNAMLSKSLGEKNRELASKAANNGIFLAFCSFLLFVLVGLFLVKPFYVIQVKGDQALLDYGVSYLRICCCCSLGVYIQIVFERIMQGTGRTVYTMFTQLTGAIINLILDPMFIFGIGFFPRLEVAGAAIATVIGQCCAALVGVALNHWKNREEITVSLHGILHPEGHVIARIYKVGIPTIIMQAIGSVMTFTMDMILVSFTKTAVAVFGVYFKLQSFFFMPVFGMNNALVPIIAYNYGARKKQRMVNSIKLGVRYAMIIMVIGCLLFELIPGQLLGLFDASEEMKRIGIIALRAIGTHFPLAAVCIILITTLQALGYAFYSMFVSIGRQLVVLIPAALILARVGGLNAVWWSFLIAEFMSLALCVYYFLRVKRNVIDPL
jgi:putative MATE family efflux protein